MRVEINFATGPAFPVPDFLQIWLSQFWEFHLFKRIFFIWFSSIFVRFLSIFAWKCSLWPFNRLHYSLRENRAWSYYLISISNDFSPVDFHSIFTMMSKLQSKWWTAFTELWIDWFHFCSWDRFMQWSFHKGNTNSVSIKTYISRFFKDFDCA